MRKEQAFATISSENKRVCVELSLLDCERTISRSFHAICDAERWLKKLVERGLQQSDCKYLFDPARTICTATSRTNSHYRQTCGQALCTSGRLCVSQNDVVDGKLMWRAIAVRSVP